LEKFKTIKSIINFYHIDTWLVITFGTGIVKKIEMNKPINTFINKLNK